MLGRSVLLAWLVAILGIVAPSIASAAIGAEYKTRVWDFDLAADARIGRSNTRTAEKHRENACAYDENASGSPLAAEGLGGAGRSTATVFLHEGGHATVLTEVGAEALHTEQVVLQPTRLTTIGEVAAPRPVTNSVQLTLPNGSAAQAYQRSMIGRPTGIYNRANNNCLGHCGNVLRAGGVEGFPSRSISSNGSESSEKEDPMPTNSPLLDLVIEIVTTENVGLPTIEAAGEVISADAAFNIRMADAQGNTTFETMRRTAREYEAEVESLRAAWTSFKEAIETHGVFQSEPHETLVAALNSVRDRLTKIE